MQSQDEILTTFANDEIDKIERRRDERRDAFASRYQRDVRASDYLYRKMLAEETEDFQRSARINTALCEFVCGFLVAFIIVFCGAWAIGLASVL